VNVTSIRRFAAPAAVLVFGLGLAACTPPNEMAAGADEGLSGKLNGGGASSQEAAQTAWRAGFQRAHPDVTVNYDPIGSGGGREQFIAGGYAFAGTDAYLDNEEGELDAATERCGEHPIEVPDYVSPIAVVYHLEGVEELSLSPDTLAGIFAGTISSWDDPAIAEDNPDAALPSEPINAVHRSDDSGTTENFTAYLDAAAGDVWTEGVVETWPIDGGEGAQGTSGVVSAVQNSVGSIGYADASQAGDLGVAAIGVGGDYVLPEPEAAAKILEVSPRVEGRPEVDMAFDLDHTTEESGTYPIVLTSYLIACQSYDDANTAKLVKAYLSYVLSGEGQYAAAQAAGAAPLSPSLSEEALSIVEGITSS
jgi:phosphate transport system substrate-binding protein